MTKVLIVAGILLLLCIVVFKSQEKVNPKPSSPPTLPELRPVSIDRNKEVKELWESWKKDFDLVATKVHSKDLQAVRDLLFQADVSVPIDDDGEGGYYLLDQGKKKSPLTILAFSDNFLKKSTSWRFLKEGTFSFATAIYDSNQHTVVIAEPKNSRVTNAIILSHEGYHAYEQLILHKDIDTPEEKAYFLDEVRAHEFNYKVLAEYGGESYQVALQRMKKTVSSIIEIRNGKLPSSKHVNQERFKAVFNTEYEPLLDKVYGEPPQTTDEKNIRQQSLFADALLKNIDEQVPLKDQPYMKGFAMSTLFPNMKKRNN